MEDEEFRPTGRQGVYGGPDPLASQVSTVEDSARGVRFLEAAVESSRRGTWTDAALDP